jgi:hypothetical protein
MAEETMTDAEWAKAVEDMREAGRGDGAAAGSWVADGNTSEDALRNLLRMWEEGDPAAPCPPSPFSGEWADDPTLSEVIDSNTDCDPDTLTPEEADELATAYEDAYSEAWQAEAERTVRGLLGEDSQ